MLASSFARLSLITTSPEGVTEPGNGVRRPFGVKIYGWYVFRGLAPPANRYRPFGAVDIQQKKGTFRRFPLKKIGSDLRPRNLAR